MVRIQRFDVGLSWYIPKAYDSSEVNGGGAEVEVWYGCNFQSLAYNDVMTPLPQLLILDHGHFDQPFR
jgi:hypothetical protein